MRQRATRLSATGGNCRRISAPAAPEWLPLAQVFMALWVPPGSAYSGPLVQVRRSSDNQELDFYATPITDDAGRRWVDSAAILAFTGSGSGFVARLYDQVTGAFAQQTDVNRQMLIVSAGGMETINGMPAINNSSAARFLTYSGFPTSGNSELMAVFQSSTTSGSLSLFGSADSITYLPIASFNNTSTNVFRVSGLGDNPAGLEAYVNGSPTPVDRTRAAYFDALSPSGRPAVLWSARSVPMAAGRVGRIGHATVGFSGFGRFGTIACFPAVTALARPTIERAMAEPYGIIF